MSNVVRLHSAREREQRLHDDVLDAAERCIVENGLGATTFELIAGTADVSCSAVRRQFDDKRSLVQALMERGYERAIRTMWLLQPPPHQDATTFIAGALEDWLVADANQRRRRLDLEMDLAAARDPELAQYARRLNVSLVQNLGDLLRRMLRDHGWSGSEAEFQARVYAVAAMCGGLHIMMTTGVELNRMHLQLILSESLAGIFSTAQA